MSRISTHTWKGQSGRKYSFKVYRLCDDCKFSPGVCIVAKQKSSDWQFVGVESEDFGKHQKAFLKMKYDFDDQMYVHFLWEPFENSRTRTANDIEQGNS